LPAFFAGFLAAGFFFAAIVFSPPFVFLLVYRRMFFPGNEEPGAIMIASSSATGGKFSGTAKGPARSARTDEALKQSALTSAFLKHGARQGKHEF
jgi:hypothetical protein